MPKPSIEDFALFASQIGLPESEAERAWFFYDCKGWKVGKAPMVSWKSALQLWKRTYLARTAPKAQAAPEPQWAKEKRLKAELETLRARLFKVGDVSPIHSHEQAAAIRAARAPICERIKAVKQELNII